PRRTRPRCRPRFFVRVVERRTWQALALSCAGLTRASIFLRRVGFPMDRPVKPGDDDRRSASGRQRGLGLLADHLECARLADREIGQQLAVDRDPGFAEAGDKSAVGQPEAAHRGVEALDPQGAERALAPLAVAERILVCLLDRLLGDADRVLAPAV